MMVGSARDLGLYVRDRRRDLGWSQSDLAVAAGVSRPWLSDLEAGKTTAEIGLIMMSTRMTRRVAWGRAVAERTGRFWR